MSGFKPFAWEGIKVHSSGLRYNVRLEDYVLRGESGGEEAVMFTWSYTMEKGDPSRPVIFAYNGGPGSPSAWLHMGLLGPKLVEIPGYPSFSEGWRIRDNEEFLLDQCDLVLVDPAGTGWAGLLDQEAAGEYYSVAGDGRAFARLIAGWLKDRGREKSPVYILGESYGTIRSLALADALPETIDLRGIIHIGVSFNVGAKGAMYVEPNVRRLGANAAACRYHYHQDVEEEKFIKDAMEFACGDYARALLLGSRLDRKEYEEVLGRLAYYTGLDPDMLRRNHLRFSEQNFMLGLGPGSLLSMCDSRLTHVFKSGEHSTKYDLKYDPFMEGAADIFEEALLQYAGSELAVPEGRRREASSVDIAERWDYAGYKKDTLALPEELMKVRPRLQMLFVSGRYDLSSTFDFVDWYLSHYDLDPERTDRLVLPSGHASYVGAGMAEELSRRIRKFVCSSR